MADNFGLKLGVEGEREFKCALADINRGFKVLGSEMKLVESQFDKNDRSVQALSSRNEVLNKQIEAQKGKIETLRAALKNSAESFGENDRRTQNWQIQLNNAEAALNGMERELKDNAKEMDDLSHSADDMSKEIKDAGKTAEKSESIFKNLGNVLKNVGATLVAAAEAIGMAAVAAGKKIWDMANETAAAGDEIDKESQKLGLSAENYQKLSYAMDRCGADVEDFKKGTMNISKTLADVQNGVSGAGSSFDALGVSLRNSDGSMRSTEEVLLDSIDALAGIEDVTQRNALANEIFGKSYTELAPLLNSGSDGIKALMDEAEKYGMVMSDDAVAASAKFQDSLTKLNGTINGVKNNLIGRFLPGLSLMIDGFTELASGCEEGGRMIKEGIGNLLESANEIIPQIIDLLMVIAEAILENAPAIIESLATEIINQIPALLELALSDILPQLISTAIGIAKKLVISLSDALPDIIVALTQGLVTILDELFSQEHIVETVDIIIGAIENVIAGLRQALPILIRGATTLIQGLISALPEIVELIVDEIPAIIDMIFNSEHGLLSEQNISMLVDGAVDAVSALMDNLPTIISKLISSIPVIIDRIFDTENGFLNVNNIKKLIEGAIKIIGEIVKHIPDIIKELLEAIPGIIKDIISAFWGLVNEFLDLGKECFKNFSSGFTSGSISALVKKANGEDYEIKIFQPAINFMEDGGVLEKGQTGYLEGNGAEAVVPLERNPKWIQRVSDQFYAAIEDLFVSRNTFSVPTTRPNYEININFGDVRMASDLDIENVAHQVSDLIVSDIIVKGGVYA